MQTQFARMALILLGGLLLGLSPGILIGVMAGVALAYAVQPS